MVRPPLPLLGAGLLLGLFVSGCVGTTQGAADEGLDALPEDQGLIRGRIVDAEIVPLADVLVTAIGTDLATATDRDGSFQLGPLDPALYTVTAAKEGYAPTQEDVQVFAGETRTIHLTLAAVASHVPYHETRLIVALLDCSWAITSATFPCVPIDRVTGQNVTGDKSAWKFAIPAPGLANLLHEMQWQPQPIGREMKVVITEPNQPVFIGGVTRFYLVNQGPSPLRAWLEDGKTGVGGSVKFNGNESTRYDAYIRGSPANNTIPQAALYLDQKANNWFTFFYNRPGPPGYTALPDR